MADAPAYHGSQAVGAVDAIDLKKRIQGFGNGPEPPPLEENSWWTSTLLEIGDTMGLGPLQSSPQTRQQEAASLEVQITAWVESAKQSWDSVVAALDEEISGEPRMTTVPPISNRSGLGRDGTGQPQKSAREQAAEDKDSPGIYQVTVPDTIVSKTRTLGGECVAKLQTGFRWAEKADQWRKVTTVPSAMGCTNNDHSENADNGDGRDGQPVAETSTEMQQKVEAEADAGSKELISFEESVPVQESVQPRVKSAELLFFDEDSPCKGNEKADSKKAELILFNEDIPEAADCKVEAGKESKKPLTFDDDHPGIGNCKQNGMTAEALSVGDKVMRKGEEAVIVAIDRTMDPPGFVVRMVRDGREISTESYLLHRVQLLHRELAMQEADSDLLNFASQQNLVDATTSRGSSGVSAAEMAIPRLPPPPQKRLDQVSELPSPAKSVSQSLPRGISIFGEDFNPPPRQAAASPELRSTEFSLQSSYAAMPRGFAVFEPIDEAAASLAPCSNEFNGVTPTNGTAPLGPSMFDELPGAPSGNKGTGEANDNVLPRAPRGISIFDPFSDKNLNGLGLS